MSGTKDNAERLLALLNGPPSVSGLGNLRQAENEGSAARSNADWLGVPILDEAMVATEKGTTSAIPVQIGDVFSKILLPFGKTSGKKVEKAYCALYAGKKDGALLAQSKEANLVETAKKETTLPFTLESAVTITSAMAPNGYIYAQFGSETETMPTGIGWTLSAEAQASWAAVSAASVMGLGGKASKALKGKADAKLGESEAFAAVANVICFILQ
jgi:hypothetical protein